MSSRNPGLIAAAVLAAALAAAPAFAQTAPDPADPGLRGGEAALPSGNPADALPDINAAPDDAPPAKPKRKAGVLPPLAPYSRAAKSLRGAVDPPVAPPLPPPTVAALPAPPKPRLIKREDKPFDPVGLYVGDLKLTPYFEQSAGYASNPFGAANAKGSMLSVSEAGVGLQSNWSRNELSGSAKLGYNDYLQTPSASAPYGNGVLDYRFDASRDLTFDTEGRYSLSSETNAQLGLGGSTGQNTTVSTYGATIGGANNFGDLTIGLHGTADRLQYGGGDLATDDYNDYGLKLRGSYRLSEAVSPFAEVDGDVRVYDTAIDASGYDRASTGISGLAGLRLSLSEMVTGEVSVGYGEREYRDPRLPFAQAPLFNSSLIWSVTPLTTVTLKTATALADAVVAGASADINRTYALNLDHALTERVKLGLSGAITTDTYVGRSETDTTYALGATAEYHLSREVVIKASAMHTKFVSPQPGASYAADTVLLGVRLQR